MLEAIALSAGGEGSASGNANLHTHVLATALNHWSATVMLHLKILEEARSVSHNVQPGFDKELTLLLFEGKVLFVGWDNWLRMMGRTYELDSSLRVKWSIPGLAPIKDFTGATMIHNALGVRPCKTTGDLRPELPDRIRLLFLMWRASMGKGTSTGKPSPFYIPLFNKNSEATTRCTIDTHGLCFLCVLCFILCCFSIIH